MALNWGGSKPSACSLHVSEFAKWVGGAEGSGGEFNLNTSVNKSSVFFFFFLSQARDFFQVPTSPWITLHEASHENAVLL